MLYNIIEAGFICYIACYITTRHAISPLGMLITRIKKYLIISITYDMCLPDFQNIFYAIQKSFQELILKCKRA